MHGRLGSVDAGELLFLLGEQLGQPHGGLLDVVKLGEKLVEFVVTGHQRVFVLLKRLADDLPRALERLLRMILERPFFF